MKALPKTSIVCLLSICAGTCVGASPAPQEAQRVAGTATIRRVALLRNRNDIEVEINANQPVSPQTRVLSGPDRVVIDFPNAVPGSELRNFPVNRGEVKAIRVGLFENNPPVTRVVLDLKTPQTYQIFPSGNTVIVKVGAGGSGNSTSAAANLPAQPRPPQPTPVQPALLQPARTQQPALRPQTALPQQPAVASAKPPLEVSFQNGLLSVRSERASLAQVLYEVHRHTGADIAVPAGAEREQVVTNLGPGPAKEVLASLLNGSHYNFIILGADEGTGSLGRVILSPRFEGAAPAGNFSPPPPGAEQSQNLEVPPPENPPAAENEPISDPPAPENQPVPAQPVPPAPPDPNAPQGEPPPD